MNGTDASWIDINAPALLENLAFFRRRLTGNARLFPVIKANAYGHGMNLVAGILADTVDGFCVHSLADAMTLETTRPVLVLGHVPDDPDLLGDALVRHSHLSLTVSTPEQLDTIRTAARRVSRVPSLFIKVETGTMRLGLSSDAAMALADTVASDPHLNLAGFSTHFANIEDTTDHGYAMAQLDRFLAFREQVTRRHRGLQFHAACSAAALLFPETHLDIVRLGISLYGYFSSRETLVSWRQTSGQPADNGLVPVLSWRTRPIQVKDAPAGTFVGYGLTHRTTRNTRIAVLPVGYWDGYDRRLSGVAHVLVHGKRAPVVGRICMNMCMVDVGDIPDVRRDSVFTLIGSDGQETISAETLATWCGSIHYEILSRLNPAIPRRIVPQP